MIFDDQRTARSIRKIPLACWQLVLLCCLSNAAWAGPSLIPAPPSLSAKAHYLIDTMSGKVIVENNADEKLGPASLTKMMTSYVLSYELAQGNVSSTDMVTVSKNAWAQNFPGSSLMWIEVGTKVSVSDLHKGVVISSGNDASVAIAEHIAGSEDAFADVMNKHAEIMGMSNTHFVNSHGLPDPDHYTTAKDLAILAQAIINDFPDDYTLYKEKSFTYNNIKTMNRNSLLWRDPSVDGLKTGHTEAAGYCLVASAEKNGMRLVSVVLGTNNKEMRLQETQKLFSYGFRYFETHKLYKAKEELNASRVWAGLKQTVSLGISEDIILTIPRGEHKNVKAQLEIDDVIKAPVALGSTYGTVSIMLNDEQLLRVPLVALEEIEKAGLFAWLWDEIKLFVMQLLGL